MVCFVCNFVVWKWLFVPHPSQPNSSDKWERKRWSLCVHGRAKGRECEMKFTSVVMKFNGKMKNESQIGTHTRAHKRKQYGIWSWQMNCICKATQKCPSNCLKVSLSVPPSISTTHSAIYACTWFTIESYSYTKCLFVYDDNNRKSLPLLYECCVSRIEYFIFHAHFWLTHSNASCKPSRKQQNNKKQNATKRGKKMPGKYRFKPHLTNCKMEWMINVI